MNYHIGDDKLRYPKVDLKLTCGTFLIVSDPEPCPNTPSHSHRWWLWLQQLLHTPSSWMLAAGRLWPLWAVDFGLTSLLPVSCCTQTIPVSCFEAFGWDKLLWWSHDPLTLALSGSCEVVATGSYCSVSLRFTFLFHVVTTCQYVVCI